METKYSEILQQNIYIDRNKKIVKTEDGLTYTNQEMQFLKNQRPCMVQGLHKIKLFFDGEICPEDTKRSQIKL